MTFKHQIYLLFNKEWQLELKQKQILWGLAVYLFTTIFLIYILENTLSKSSWNTLFWITTIFLSINANSKSFLNESNYRQLFYYSRFNPLAILYSKIIYNSLLSFLFSLVTFFIFIFLFPLDIQNIFQYLGIIVLATVSISLVLTFISSMAAQIKNGGLALSAILGLPLLIPIFFFIQKLTTFYLENTIQNNFVKMMGILVLYDILIIILSSILFPFIWKDS